MNILIVDDNENNRLILKLLLEDYFQANDEADFHIKEAYDGLEAVQMCKENSFNIVFMDIMMPIMDGIEATRLIREYDHLIMIIAVSATGDNESKKQILNNGAEDYISKPVNYDVFMSRMKNYISLIQTRIHEKRNIGKINLFTDEIYKRHTKFIINSEDALSEFWEFFLLNEKVKYDNLSDLIRTIFSIVDTQIQRSIQSSIYIEESDEIQYFTLTDIYEIQLKDIELIIKKNSIICQYKILDEKISFGLEKNLSINHNNSTNPYEASNNTTEIVPPEEVVASPVVFKQSSKELIVFDYIEEEDLTDLIEYSNHLNSLMLIVGSGSISEEEIIDIYSHLDKISSILSTYSEIYVIAQALSELSHDISTHISEFIQNSEALGTMCTAFSNDMSNWVSMSFQTGAPSVDFMNDTIVVNCKTIGSMLKIDEEPTDNGDFDDIFDF